MCIQDCIKEYIMYMDPGRRFSSMSEGKNKNKISWPAGVEGKKNKKGEIDRFSVKMAIFRGKNSLVPALWPCSTRQLPSV